MNKLSKIAASTLAAAMLLSFAGQGFATYSHAGDHKARHAKVDKIKAKAKAAKEKAKAKIEKLETQKVK